MAKKRNPQGDGSVRQRKDGRWECRITFGKDPGTGKQIRKSFYADTQKELLAIKNKVLSDLDNKTYQEPSKITVSAWLDEWVKTFIPDVKESTKASYKGHIKNHIKPNLGAVLVQKLTSLEVQQFYNKLYESGKSAKTVKNIHGVLHQALKQAVKHKIIKENPATEPILPKIIKPDIKVMDDNTVTQFLGVIEGHQFEAIYFTDLLTGMRQAEILGLSWDCVNFKKGTILIKQQLVKSKLDGRYYIDTTKHDKVRKITPAPVVMEKLKLRKSIQAADQLRAGASWTNEWNLVFTDAVGKHLIHHTVRKNFKRIVAGLGYPDLTFHGLRHLYAVMSLVAGDDPKTVQENLGHHSAAFTLNTYAHATEGMKQDSSSRMQKYYDNLVKSKDA